MTRSHTLRASVFLIPVLAMVASVVAQPCATDADCMIPPRLRCDTLAGECVQCTQSSQCQDGAFCNGLEVCNTSTGLCSPGTPPVCPKTCFRGDRDDLPCDTDANCPGGGVCLGFCSKVRAACVQCDEDAGCYDDQFCNGPETCENDLCQAHPAPVCRKCVGGAPPDVPCSEDRECPGGTCTGPPSYCHEPAGTCVACLDSSHCSDDLNFCTTNSCVSNTCTHPYNSAICSDGAFCTGEEICNFVLGNPCSVFSDAAHCCFKGLCDPPKTCTTNSQCVTSQGQFCNQQTGVCSPDLGCNSNADCQAGQTCVNDTVPQCGDGFACTADSCNETTNSCQNVPNDGFCTDGLACSGTEMCEPGDPSSDPDGCIQGTPVDCSHLDAECHIGSCREAPLGCTTTSFNQGDICQDDNPCTALSKCNNGSCTDIPPAMDDPSRCVRLEFRPATIPPVTVGSTVELGLYAVAIGCNVRRCVGGTSTGQPCALATDCPGGSCTGALTFCDGGANDDLTCSVPADCPGGTCIADCAPNEMRVVSIDALLSWNPSQLQLQPSTAPEPNPEDPCGPGVDPCTVCPPNQYPWGFSGWIADCGNGDGLNAPCTGMPANDGNAHYLGFLMVCDDLMTFPPPACATPAGLHVTTFKFRALSGTTSGSPAKIDFLRPPPPASQAYSCYGEESKTAVRTDVFIPTVPTDDVTKSIGAAVNVTITCDEHSDCNDNNVCTTDSCSCTTPGCGGLCSRINNTVSCDDALFCTLVDQCSGGVCVGSVSPCTNCSLPGPSCRPHCDEDGDICVQCFTNAHCSTDGLNCTVDTCVNEVCQQTPVNCNDGVDCTDDACTEPSATCMHAPDHTFCNPSGAFCLARLCQPPNCPGGVCNPPQSGCVFDHPCISGNGNPCPDPASCIESGANADTCGGCLPPTVTPLGSRYLGVTPVNQGSTPIALLVTGDCGDATANCVYRYVQSKCLGGASNGQNCITDADCPRTCAGGVKDGDACTSDLDCPPFPIYECVGRCDSGTLGATPVYMTSAQWATAKVRGAQIRPGTEYLVHAECDFGGGPTVSAAATEVTWRWGDVDNDGDADGIDVTGLVNAFRNIPGAPPFERANLWGKGTTPCVPDNSDIDALDIALGVDAFRGFAFPCVVTCP